MRIRPAPLLLLLLFATPPTRPVCADWGPVHVRVAETAGVERKDWPVAFSVPLPRGAKVDDARVVVRDAGGRALPTQARTFVRWPDGSPRWLRVDTRVAVPRRGDVGLRVEAGTAPAPAAALRVEESDAGIAIDTGAIQFTIPRDRGAVLTELRFSGQKDAQLGPAVFQLDTAQGGGRAGAPSELRVLERGPLRCRVRMRGSYGGGFDYEIRLEAFAGEPFVRILHTFAKTGGGAYSEMRRLALELPMNGAGGGDYSYGRWKHKAITGHLDEGGKLRLLQEDNQHYRIDGGGAEEGALGGWLEAEHSGSAVGVAARWFWQEYPQAFQLEGKRLVYELRAGDVQPRRIGIGAAKTHELVLWLAKRGAVGKRDAPALREPLSGAVDPVYLARTGALPGAIAPPAGGFVDSLAKAAERYLQRNAREEWNDCGQPLCDEAPERRRSGAFGMLNWGDWNFPGYQDDTKGTDAWGNLEYDTAQVLALAYAASGRPHLLDATVAAARHFMDVDTIHALPPRPDWVGMNHPKNPMHFVFELGGVDLGHTWNEGLLSYYYLTADERGLEAARGIADYLTARIGAGVRGNPRQWGWPQIALLAAYDATGEGRYLEAARQYALQGMAAHPAKGLRSWKGGILADALAHTHAATGDAKIAAWLGEYANYITKSLIHQDARYYPAIAYLAALRGDAGLRQKALKVALRLKLGSWGKPFTSGGRIGLRIHALLDGDAPAPPARIHPTPGPALTSARLR